MVRAASFTACGGRYGEVVGDVSVDWIFSFIGGVDVVVAEPKLWFDFMFCLDESLRLTPPLLAYSWWWWDPIVRTKSDSSLL